jgi:hypothetical protein
MLLLLLSEFKRISIRIFPENARKMRKVRKTNLQRHGMNGNARFAQ